MLARKLLSGVAVSAAGQWGSAAIQHGEPGKLAAPATVCGAGVEATPRTSPGDIDDQPRRRAQRADSHAWVLGFAADEGDGLPLERSGHVDLGDATFPLDVPDERLNARIGRTEDVKRFETREC